VLSLTILAVWATTQRATQIAGMLGIIESFLIKLLDQHPLKMIGFSYA
jgi:hypothetical protein